MARGKQTCKILKEIRKQIAEDNDINLVIEECTYQGDCQGTCPTCEAEVRYLERELEKRQRMGKAAVFAGMSIGTLITAAACGSTSDAIKSTAKGPDGTEVTQTDTIERELEGLVKMYYNVFNFDSVYYQTAMKDKFVNHEMEDLTIVSGAVHYQSSSGRKVCESMEELVENTKEFKPPFYRGGEQQLRKDIAARMKEDHSKYSGDLAVEFTVEIDGKVKDVVVVKGLDPVLDADIVSIFEQMEWNPGVCILIDHGKSDNGRLVNSNIWFDCRCIKELHFPIIIDRNRVKPLSNPDIDRLEGKPSVLIKDRDK